MNVDLGFFDRRPMMTLLSGSLDIYSHCCRIIMIEKDIECAVEYISMQDDPAKVGEHNPYGETPTLMDRDIVLYNMWVITEYLDERFPHPPLMPADPTARAKTRLIVSRMTRDWLQPIYELGETATPRVPAALRRNLHDGLLSLSRLITDKPFFMGAEYSLVDVYFAPLLWRLPSLGVELPSQAASLLEYAESLFRRPAFTESLSRYEAELR